MKYEGMWLCLYTNNRFTGITKFYACYVKVAIKYRHFKVNIQAFQALIPVYVTVCSASPPAAITAARLHESCDL